MTEPLSAFADDEFEEVEVKRANPYLRALWIIGAGSILLAVVGLVAAQFLYGSSGFSFDSRAIPITYYIASIGSAASTPLLMGGLISVALALSVSALSTHLTRLAGAREIRSAREPLAADSAVTVVSSPVVDPVPTALDPRLFMRPPTAGDPSGG